MLPLLPDAEALKDAATLMVQEVNRLDRVVSELLEFARPHQMHTGRHNINDIILKANTIIPKNKTANLYIISDMQKTFLDGINTNIDNNIDPVFDKELIATNGKIHQEIIREVKK